MLKDTKGSEFSCAITVDLVDSKKFSQGKQKVAWSWSILFTSL